MKRSLLATGVLALVALACGGKDSAPRLSAPGDSCLKTSDCVDGASCVDQKCVAPGGGAAGRTEARENLDSPEALGRAVLEALKSGDYTSFADLMLTMQDAESLFESNHRAVTEEMRRYVLKEFGPKIKEMIQATREGWDAVRLKAKQAGIVWSATSYARVEFKMKRVDNVDTADIYLVFEHGAVDYKIKLDDCLKTPRGWRVRAAMIWKG